MERLILNDLLKWKNAKYRKPLILKVVVSLTVDRILQTIYCAWYTTTYAIYRMWVQF